MKFSCYVIFFPTKLVELGRNCFSEASFIMNLCYVVHDGLLERTLYFSS